MRLGAGGEVGRVRVRHRALSVLVLTGGCPGGKTLY